MKPISKIDTRIERTAYGWLGLWLSLPFVAIGSYFALAGFGVLPLPGKANAPLWVIAAIGVAFAMLGGILLLASLRGLWHRWRKTQLDPAHRRGPWYGDYPWDPAGIGDGALARPFKLLMYAVFLAVFLVPFNWLAFFSKEGVMPVRIITGIFDAILALMVLAFVYRLAQALKYGRCWLAFDRFPFAPGQALQVRYHGPLPGPLQVTLRFVEERFERRRHRRNESSYRAYEHYSAQQQIDPATQPPDHRQGVPIRFELPDDPAWVTQLTADPSVRYWELLVEAQTPGIDLRTSFPLPVYAGASGQVPPPADRRALPRPRIWPRIPYGFEIGLPLLLAGTVWLVFNLAPDATRRALEQVEELWHRQQTVWQLLPVEGVGAAAMAARTGPDGRVWVLTKYSLDRFDGTRRENLLDTQRYRALFGHKVNALSALLVTGADEAWIGSWYGELFHYRDGQWRQLTRRDQPLGWRIHALAMGREGLILATARGLWQWRQAEARLDPVEALPAHPSEAIASGPGGELCAALHDALWCRSGGDWQPRWRAPDRILALRASRLGEWRVGTRHGFFTVDSGGSAQGPDLPEQWVTGFTEQDGALWVATWQGGIWRRDERGWRGLSTGSLSEITLDRDDTLWLASYDTGLLRVPSGRLSAALR